MLSIINALVDFRVIAPSFLRLGAYFKKRKL